MNHGSLFSGIGGFDLAAEWMGWNNVFHCEWMPFPRQILKYHFPNSISYEDITKTDFTIHRGTIDILTGGFPCQPYSVSGKRLGKEDERHLWPEMLRAIQEIEPWFVVGENVRGLVNWNGGLVFEEVQADLENAGYEVIPFIIPACAVAAPHRRDRVWFVAHANNKGRSSRLEEIQGKNGEIPEWNNDAESCNASERRINALKDIDKNVEQRFTFNTNRERFKRSISTELIGQFSDEKNVTEVNLLSVGRRRKKISFERFPTQSPICGGDDGLPTELDGITFSKWRNESIKGYGNAVVPQLVYQIFKAIEKSI